MSFALVNPQHENVSYPDRQMMSQQGSKTTILHVERNDIPIACIDNVIKSAAVYTQVYSLKCLVTLTNN